MRTQEVGHTHQMRVNAPRTVRRRLTVIAMLSAFAVAVSGCSVPIDDDAFPINPDELPESLRPGFTPTTTTKTASTPLTEAHTVYLLTDPQDIERTVVVAVERQVTIGGTLRDVLFTLFGKTTTPEEHASGYFNTLELFTMSDVIVRDDVVTVNIVPLSAEDIPPPANTLKLAAAQLVFTIAAWGASGTRILLDDTEVSIPTSDDDAEPGSILRVGAYEQFHPDLDTAVVTTTTTAPTTSTVNPDTDHHPSLDSDADPNAQTGDRINHYTPPSQTTDTMQPDTDVPYAPDTNRSEQDLPTAS